MAGVVPGTNLGVKFDLLGFLLLALWLGCQRGVPVHTCVWYVVSRVG